MAELDQTWIWWNLGLTLTCLHLYRSTSVGHFKKRRLRGVKIRRMGQIPGRFYYVFYKIGYSTIAVGLCKLWNFFCLDEKKLGGPLFWQHYTYCQLTTWCGTVQGNCSELLFSWSDSPTRHCSAGEAAPVATARQVGCISCHTHVLTDSFSRSHNTWIHQWV